jgi:division/cell wall cluster transcriptional repressor MraZ
VLEFGGGIAEVFNGVVAEKLYQGNRVKLPAAWLQSLRRLRALVLTVDPQGCVLGYPRPEWEKVERRLMDLPSLIAQARRLQRLMVGHSTGIKIDKSGRIAIPSELAEYAGLKRDVVFVGQANRFELWNGSAWARLVKEYRKEPRPTVVADQLVDDLVGPTLYDQKSDLELPPQKLLLAIEPQLVVVQTTLADRMKRSPKDMFGISSREFESLIAEILSDQGWNVHLTPRSKDGGFDVMASQQTDVGNVLCLVEAKRYHPDNKVGVEIVRGLYGVLESKRATLGMIASTSAFTSGAQEFERMHQYRLSLKDYTDIVGWLSKFGDEPRGRHRGQKGLSPEDPSLLPELAFLSLDEPPKR